jgi:hypothetical protein
MVVSFGCSVFGQQPQKVKSDNSPEHSVSKAAILSAVLPGAGQIYNKSYWKAPIIWAGLGFFTYQYIDNNNKYQAAKTSYLSILDNPQTAIPYNGTTDLTQVQFYKQTAQNNRDMFMVFGILFWGLNIVEATVDAHLLHFDVSDNLSMHIAPSYQSNLYSSNFGLSLNMDISHKKAVKLD